MGNQKDQKNQLTLNPKIVIFVILLGILVSLFVPNFAKAELREAPTMENVSTIQHEVASGDTMYLISIKYHVSLEDLIKINPQIENPHWIYPKERLNIPNYQEIKHR